MSLPLCNQADLMVAEPRRIRERRRWDLEGYERTEIRDGATRCPVCGLWWPHIAQPDGWEWNHSTLRWDATSWWGGVVCSLCDLLLVEQPDGTPECYDIGK